MKKIILLLIILSSLVTKGQTGAQIPCFTCSNGSVSLGSKNLKTTGSATFGSVYAGSITYSGTPVFTTIVVGSNTITSTTSTLTNLVIPSQSLATGITVKVDNTGNVFPFIIDGTNGGNAEAIAQGSVNSRYTLKNTTTSTSWRLSNQTA